MGAGSVSRGTQTGGSSPARGSVSGVEVHLLRIPLFVGQADCSGTERTGCSFGKLELCSVKKAFYLVLDWQIWRIGWCWESPSGHLKSTLVEY